MNFKRVLVGSGLTKVELAILYGVSRQTIHTWTKGGVATGYTARMAETITRALETAITRRLLPLGALSKEARRVRIARMAKTLQNLKPALAR